MLPAMAKLPGGARALLLSAATVTATVPATVTATVACGGPRPPSAPAPAPPPPGTKAFAPLAFKQDARAPHQAVILGTDERDGSTILQIPGAPAAVRVDAMVVRRDGSGPATGGTTPIALSAAPSADGAVQAGAAEAPWRAGVWTAALLAARALGKDPTDLALGATPDGPVDGAALALVAGGFVEALLCAPLDEAGTPPGALPGTLAGTLLPDGTIGPVTGLTERFGGALARGKKRLGYPVGLRLARSAATGQAIDLVQLAKAGGAEALEVASVRDAGALLAGKPLPAQVPVPEAEMRLDDATARALDAAYRDLRQRLAGEWAALLHLPQSGNLPPRLLQLASRALALGEAAEKLYRTGAVAVALGELREAWVLATAATAAYELLRQVQRGDVPAAIAALDQLGPTDAAARELFGALGAIEPATIGDHLRLAGALRAALAGWSFQAFAAGERARARGHLDGLAGRRKEELAAPATADALVTAVAPALVLLGRARAGLLDAAQQLELERAETPAFACSPPDVLRRARWFQAAAAAGAADLDALIVEPAARSEGVPPDTVRVRLALSEPDTVVAHVLSNLPDGGGLPRDLQQAWGEGSRAWSLLSLAAGELAYVASAELLAKHAALEVRADPTAGGKVAAAYEPALGSLIERAERTARVNARAARIATGGIPVAARLAYQQAGARRAAGDRLAALAAYWRASAYAQTAVMLARS